MSDTPPMPPPGWYADPAGQHGARWWDGASWTDHVRPEPPADDPPPVPDHLAEDGLLSGSGRSGRRLGTVLAAVLGVGLLATIAVGLWVGDPGQPVAGAPLGAVAPGAEVPPPLDPDEVAARTDAAGCDPVVADAFLVEHLGSHGDAPEANLTPYPEGSLQLAEET